MVRNISLLFLLIIMHLSGCKQNQKVKELNAITYRNGNGSVFATGYIDEDSLPVSQWMYYKNDTCTSTGNYVDGRLMGAWSYNLQDFKGQLIWDTFLVKQYLTICYPRNFTVEKDGSELRFLDNKSHTEICFSISTETFDYSKVKNTTEDEVASEGFSISKYSCRKTTCGDTRVYAIFYDVNALNKYGLYYNIYLVSDDVLYKLKLVNFRFNQKDYQYIMTVFISMIDHLYIEKKRLFDSKYSVDQMCD